MFYKYFLEIKNRVLLIVYAWFFCMITCYFYKNVLLFLLIKINFKLYNLELFYFITTNVSDVFSVCLRLSYFINYHFIFILITYHFFTFLSSGLFKSEYYLFKSVIFISYFFFIISIVFLHLSILPVLWDFFLILQTKCDINIFFESKITEYLNFYIEIYFLMILISQIFVIIVIKLILVKKKKIFILKSRKFIYISFIIISTILTPPDVISQLCVSICLSFFYEIVVLFLLFYKYLIKNNIIIIILNNVVGFS